MQEHRKGISDAFQRIVCRDYAAYCLRQGVTATPEGLLTFLIDREVIPPPSVKRYTIRREYEAIQAREKQGKTRVVFMLSDRYNLSERSIWSILKREQSKK